MFQKTKLRLLLAYLGIIASVLGVFAIAVRIVFAHVMTQQVIDKLTILGQTVAASSEFKNGHIQVEDNFPIKELDTREQSLQWFDVQGRTILIQGNHPLSLPLQVSESIQIEEGKFYLLSVNIPIITNSDRRLIGYVRVSQSLEELHETFRKLDIGLIGGAAIALVLVAIGGVYLTRQAMQPIEASFTRLQQFTADAAHELRSPLMAIKASSQVSLRYPEGMRSSDAEEFAAIAQITEGMTRLTEDLLLLARMDREIYPNWETIDLKDLLQSLSKLFHSQAINKGITLNFQVSQSLSIQGNPSQIQRLFVNLIENAIRYTQFGGVISIQATCMGQWLEISIQDTGIGIAPEHLEKIFERFWCADSSRSEGGVGLGLAIAESITKSHGGQIRVNSKLGVGSCFTLKFPILP